MNKMKLIFPAALAAIIFGTVSAQAAANPANDAPAIADTNATPSATMASLFGDPVIAKGKGFEIKQSELDEVVLGIKSAAAAHNETIPQEQMTAIEAQMLNRLIQIQILLQQATDADKAEGKMKADLQISNLLEHAGSQETFDRQLKAVGMTPVELRSKITQEATATATLTRALGISVTDAEAKQYYADHPAEFEQPETVHIRHILLLTMDPVTHAPLPADQTQAKRKQIDDILKRAKAGEDFATLATQYSEDTSSKEKGGELPELPRDAQGIPPELLAAAFSLNTNQISDVVTMDMGYDIIKLLDKTPAQKVDYAKIADRIKDYLVQQKTQKLAPAYLNDLKKNSGSEILDPDLKAAADAAALAAATNAPAATP
ncbi:MAG TPA: peptidylprolyl isomerase [Verrucomicrobiae bacterium]|jgi:parvulin-like peptidyl-prolyl isomerase|nr:peptidylprolyl isomerase [Verrucomicrobiae bacterium]